MFEFVLFLVELNLYWSVID